MRNRWWWALPAWAMAMATIGCGASDGGTEPGKKAPAKSDTGEFNFNPVGGSDASAGFVPGDDTTTPPPPGGEDATSPPPVGDTVSQWDDATATCGFGKIYGLICSPSEQKFVNDADVWVDTVDCNGAPVKRSTKSDANGYYTLEDVPSGLQVVHVSQVNFTKEYNVQVIADKVSDVTAVAHKECFKAVQPGQCAPGVVNIPVESTVAGGAVDIVWFIDTSGSMDEETKWTQDNMNAFANYIGTQSVDFHVVLIADDEICVPPPLGGPGCTDAERFRHIHQKVDSHNGLEKIIELYPQYQDFLRPGAKTNFVAVTDDNSKKDAAWFISEAKAKSNPGFSDPFVFHSIVGMGPVWVVGCIGAAFGGTVYIDLSDKTGGQKFPICEKNWSSIFGSIAEGIVESVKTECVYAVPNPEVLALANGFSLNLIDGGAATPIPGVPAAGACGGQGFYMSGDGALLTLCPGTCEDLKSGILQIAWSCL